MVKVYEAVFDPDFDVGATRTYRVYLFKLRLCTSWSRDYELAIIASDDYCEVGYGYYNV